MEPVYHLGNVLRTRGEPGDFEGPLSLILHLLSKNKIEIRDIQISEILDQYLEYLAKMEQMDLEIASEFVQMASHLVYIKTRTLLAGEEKPEELEELMTSLEELRSKEQLAALKQIIPVLRDTLDAGLLQFVKQPEPDRPVAEPQLPAIDPVKLLRVLSEVCARKVAEPDAAALAAMAPQPVVYSAGRKSQQILAQLDRQGPTTLHRIFSECQSRSELVAAFIAVLELCSQGRLLLTALPDGDQDMMLAATDREKPLESTGEMDYS